MKSLLRVLILLYIIFFVVIYHFWCLLYSFPMSVCFFYGYKKFFVELMFSVFVILAHILWFNKNVFTLLYSLYFLWVTEKYYTHCLDGFSITSFFCVTNFFVYTAYVVYVFKEDK